MIHPRLTNLAGTQSLFLAQIGTYGAWGDLQWVTRWGDGACGMFEASWSMPLPADFDHPLLRHDTLVELMDGPWRVGSPLLLTEPTRGTGLDDPWRFTATGIGRAVEGDNSFLALDGSGNTTAVPTTAVDQAIVRGWRIAGRHASVPSFAIGATSATENLNSVGSLLNATGDLTGTRWGVTQENLVSFLNDPTVPTWHVTPTTPGLGTADDDYATLVAVRYLSSSTGTYATVFAGDADTESLFGRREFAVSVIEQGAISSTDAQSRADGILANSKGRLAWTNGLTLTSNELLSVGGVPADLSMVEAGQMVRIHGVFSDLLAFNGQTWLDIIIGETRYTDGAQSIDISPLGLAPRDLAHLAEQWGGQAA